MSRSPNEKTRKRRCTETSNRKREKSSLKPKNDVSETCENDKTIIYGLSYTLAKKASDEREMRERR